MTLLIQETARNTLIKWTKKAVEDGYGVGAVLSPFTSPQLSTGFKKSAADTSTAIRDGGGEFWLDPMTHALGMPRTGDFRYYEQWDFWAGGPRGDLSTSALVQSHLNAVFEVQSDLHSPFLAPTVLVTSPDSQQSQLALEISAAAVEAQPNCWLAVVGDSHFWSSGAELDAHIGALDQLEPAGWLLTVTRTDTNLPPAATPAEVFGLMRATYALSQDRPVRVAFGDLAALPAVAAGAETVGTGWDVRQRICAYQDFTERAPDREGGAWYQRPSLEVLLGGLTNGEFQVLKSERPALSERLAPGTIGPGAHDAFAHHARVLGGVVDDLCSHAAEARSRSLLTRYETAIKAWPEVQKVTGCALASRQWVTPFLEGVRLFMSSEGWQ